MAKAKLPAFLAGGKKHEAKEGKKKEMVEEKAAAKFSKGGKVGKKGC
jgi:hypothetical protein